MNSHDQYSAENIALSFHNLGISTLTPQSKILLSNVSGYVVKGGITAVLGASPSGKSVLLNVLAGRLPGLHVSGDITLGGLPIDPTDLQNEISCVPASDRDFLVGELTPRETLINTMLLRKGAQGACSSQLEEITKEVDNLIHQFGLTKVANNVIGTPFVRGLLGGERKRVEVCSELICSHPVLFLDEPTSGLDGCLAYEALYAIKETMKKKKMKERDGLSVLLSIHQPNRRILELFDHILILGGGGMLFFGTLQESIDYFTGIGFPPPPVYTPTDVFLQVTDRHFGTHRDMNFEGYFGCSSYAGKLHIFLNEVERKGASLALKNTLFDKDDDEENQTMIQSYRSTGHRKKNHSIRPVEEAVLAGVGLPGSGPENTIKSHIGSFFLYWKQYQTLVYRDFAIAYRDPSLYYLQALTVIAFGFCVGAVFFRVRFEVWSLMLYVNAAFSWFSMIAVYVPSFKVYHLNRANLRLKHEISNNMYNIAVAWFAELTVTSIMLLCYLPGMFLCCAMINVPAQSYPFLMFLFWMTALTSESIIGLITKLFKSPSFAMVIAQAMFVILTVFGGGLFIAWNAVPSYWYWLQEFSIFTQASRAALMEVDDVIIYPCTLTYGVCYIFSYGIFPCDGSPAVGGYFGTCGVKGRSILSIMVGTIETESKWIPFGYIVLMFGVSRLCSLLLMYYPWELICSKLRAMVCGFPSMDLLALKMELRQVKNELVSFLSIADKKTRENVETMKKLEGLISTVQTVVATPEDSRDNCDETTACVSRENFQAPSFDPSNLTLRQEAQIASIEASTPVPRRKYQNDFGNLENGPSKQAISCSSCPEAIINEVSTAVLVNYFNFDQQNAGQRMNNKKNNSSSINFFCLEWYELSVTLKKNDRVLIDNVSGCALPGRILAIMGPSGAGKTTLLNGLTNRCPHAKITGQVIFGKREFSSQDLMVVPQYDEFNQNMTVFEMIAFTGTMKCANEKKIHHRLMGLLKILGLSDKANSLCSELSSGELKRVSVGMGMITNPNVLFLDEPTRGLDSTAAYTLVKYLRDLSKATNIVVLMSIHQPAQLVFDMLEDLYLLDRDGKLAYFGPSNCCEAYFGKYGFHCPSGLNAVDFYLDLIANPMQQTLSSTNREVLDRRNGRKITQWSDLYLQSHLAQNIEMIMEATVALTSQAKNPPAGPSYMKRFSYMVNFFWRYHMRDMGLYYLRFLFLLICAVFVGTLFLQLQPVSTDLTSYPGAAFFAIWIVLFSVVAATSIYAADRRQAIELVKNAVIVPSFYCMAQFITSLPFNFVGAVLFQSIFHWLTNINPDYHVFIYGVFLTLGHLLLMEGIMLTVVALCKNALFSTTCAMVVLAYLFLFSGFFLASSMPDWISWVCNITPTFYSFRGYLWMVFINQNYLLVGTGGEFASGLEILVVTFNLSSDSPWNDFGTLIGWVFLFRVLHFFFFGKEVWSYLRAPSLEPRKKKKAKNQFPIE